MIPLSNPWMEQPSESETQNGHTKSPRSNSGVITPIATTTTNTVDDFDDDAAGDASQVGPSSPPADASSGTFSPPYWKYHDRTKSSTSEASLTYLRPPPIQLEDHSDEDHEVGRACWARHVSIDDYVVVGGGGAVAGTYVVWNCTVETLKGAPFTIRKRLAIYFPPVPHQGPTPCT